MSNTLGGFKMIGRTLDAILSPVQILATEHKRVGCESIIQYLINDLRNFLLPVEKYEYLIENQKDEEKVVLSENNWSAYFSTDWQIKRECAKAFEKRRTVKIGDSFKLEGTVYTGFGTFKEYFDVERISKNAVTYRTYLISSDKNELILNQNKRYIPILYSMVIW